MKNAGKKPTADEIAKTAERGENAPEDSAKPVIKKLGTVRTYICESTPFVLNGKLYRYEAIRGGFAKNPDETYSQILDQETGKKSEPFAEDYVFGSAFVEDDTVYVTGTLGNSGKQVQIFSSMDLKNWESWVALDLPDFGMWNTSICKDDHGYVMMVEIDKPAEQTGVGFTARFAKSDDLQNWEMTPPECVHTKERYSADGSLRYLDGYYYYFYCAAYSRVGAEYASEYDKGYRTDVVRSADLANWDASPFNPVLISSPEEESRIADENLTDEQRGWVVRAAKADICNSDIDFCEYQGRVIINYCWGNQKGDDHLAEAVFEGTLEEFMKGWYIER